MARAPERRREPEAEAQPGPEEVRVISRRFRAGG